jgi:hypothetical protein
MALNFPSTPSDNDVHSENGIDYIYDSSVGAWLVIVPTLMGNTVNLQVIFNNAGNANGSNGLLYDRQANILYTNTIIVTRNVTAAYFVGDGSALTGLVSGGPAYDKANAANIIAVSAFAYANGVNTNTFTKLTNATGSFAGTLTVLGDTIANANVVITPTWTDINSIYTGLRMNVTNTNSHSSSLLMDVQLNGTSKFKIRKDGVTVIPTNSAGDVFIGGGYNGITVGNCGLNYSADALIAGSGGIQFINSSVDDRDLSLVRDASDTLAQRRGTSNQTFRIYKTYTNASNYERLNLGWDGSGAALSFTAAGTGDPAQALRLLSGTAIFNVGASGGIVLGTTSGNWWTMGATGVLTGTPQTLTGSLATSAFSIAQTWNTTGAPTAINLDVTNTASDGASLLMNLKVDASSMFKVASNGVVYIPNNLILQGIDAGAKITSAFLNANTAYAKANAANIIADAAFAYANGVNTNTFTSMATAIAAFLHANTAYAAGNTTWTYAANNVMLAANSAYAKANAANIIADTAFARANLANLTANNAFSNTSGSTFNGNMFTSGNVGIRVSSTTYALEVAGSFAAQTKSFIITHPSDASKKLQYASLEGPENGVYFRGKLHGESIIWLPDYWKDLVHHDSITVHITPHGYTKQDIWVDHVEDDLIQLNTAAWCYYIVYAERKDVPKLEVEI